MRNTAAVVVNHSEEAPQFHDCVELLEVEYGLDPVLRRLVALGVDQVAEVGDFRLAQSALARVDGELVLSKPLQDSAEMLLVLLVGLQHDNYVIYKYKNEIEVPKNRVNVSLESLRGVFQAKWYDYEFIESKRGSYSRLLDIFFNHENLIIGLGEIQGGKNFFRGASEISPGLAAQGSSRELFRS